MRYQLTPNTPRPLSAVHIGVAPGRDARWADVPANVRAVDALTKTPAVKS